MVDGKWNEKAGLSADAYTDRHKDDIVTIQGVTYTILDTANSSLTGFQATAYQRADNGKVEIAYRGTEAFGDWLRDDKADVDMVRSRVNPQLAEAEAFTRKVLAEAKNLEPRYHHPIEVTTCGHSLGGTLAEIMAARHGLGGEAFNGYGAVDLAYGVPEGQPIDAPSFINHVKATDIVSAASRHYGEVHGYATGQDVVALKQGRYLDTPDPAHPANPMLTGSLGAHFISNFAPEDGKGPSILSAENEARYQQYGAAFDHFRHDVLTSRAVLHDTLNGNRAFAGSAYLHRQLGDAVGVAVYHHAVRGVEKLGGLDSARQRAERWGGAVQSIGAAAAAGSDAAAQGLRAASHRVHAAGEATSSALHEAARSWREGNDAFARQAARLAPLDPLAGSAVELGATASGRLGQYLADDLATKARLSGTMARDLGELASEGLHDAGQRLREGTQWMASQWRDAGREAQHLADALASTKAHDTLVDAIQTIPRLDQPGHPDHPMYRQAWAQVQHVDAAYGREPDRRSRNFAGALVVSAKRAGLRRIDEVTLSDDGARAFASEQVLGRTFRRYAEVNLGEAVAKPLEQSSAQAVQLPSPATPARQLPDPVQAQEIPQAPLVR